MSWNPKKLLQLSKWSLLIIGGVLALVKEKKQMSKKAEDIKKANDQSPGP
ncbi:MAG: hypothetical protein JWQ35_571 [Bacteriovoracaceae bacterium]|nr:hypothetical protein [Bacteriovoracaceae bacterium]